VTSALHDAATDPEGNVLRERYNDLIRSTYGSTGRVFDLADVESHGEKFQGIRALYSGWSKDGGHLTDAGYDAVATAMVLFVAGLFP
jgi:lysophospholipase L1-like esterase